MLAFCAHRLNPWELVEEIMSEETQKPLYELIGGEQKVRELVNAFYRNMDTLPEAQDIRAQHKDLNEANQKLFEFLSGWMGGPNLYIEKYGHPRLRARHLPFKIGTRERDQWLLCMEKALEECKIEEPSRRILQVSLSRLADHMRNQQEA